jgi:hypothetical protein
MYYVLLVVYPLTTTVLSPSLLTGEVFSPRTLRQTQVIVIPSNDEYQSSFHKFDALVESINQARRNARDYVTEVSLEKLDERMYGEGERDWRYDD